MKASGELSLNQNVRHFADDSLGVFRKCFWIDENVFEISS